MSEERIDIIIQDKVSDEPARKIIYLAKVSREANNAIVSLRKQLDSINTSSVRKLQAEMSKGVTDTVRNASALEKLEQAQLKTATAAARLERSQALASTGSTNAALAAQRLTTEMMRSEKAALSLAAAEDKLTRSTSKRTAASVGKTGNVGDGAVDLYYKNLQDLSKRADALRNSIDPLSYAQRTYNKTLEEANTLLKSGNINQTEHATAVNKATTAYHSMGQQQKKVADLTKLTRFQVLTLQYTMNDVAASLATGASPFTILMQQGGQVTQAWGGLGQTLRAAAGAIATPIGIIITGIAALTAGLLFFDNARKRVESLDRQLSITGGSAGVTGAQFLKMSEDIAASSRTTIGAAEDVAGAWAATGVLQKDQIAQLTSATLNFGKLTGESNDKIVKSWAKLTDEPGKFAGEMLKQFGTFSAVEVAHIRTLEEQGNKIAAVDAVSRKLYDYYGTNAVNSLTTLSGAWGMVSRAVSGAVNWMQKAAAPDSLEDKFAKASATLEKYRAVLADTTKPNSIGGVQDRELAQSMIDKTILEVNGLQKKIELQNGNNQAIADGRRIQNEADTAYIYFGKVKIDNQTKLNNLTKEYDENVKKLQADPSAKSQAAATEAIKNRAKAIEEFRKQTMPDSVKSGKEAAKDAKTLAMAMDKVYGTLEKEYNVLGVLGPEREKMNKLAEIELELAGKELKLTKEGREDIINYIDEIGNQKKADAARTAVMEAAFGPMQKYIDNQKAINAYLNTSAITTEEATRQTNLNTEALKQATDPYLSINRALAEQDKLYGLMGDAREIATAMLAYENELRGKGIDLNSPEQAGQKKRLENLTKENVLRNRTAKFLDTYYNDNVQNAIDLEAKTEALTQAYQRGYVGSFKYGEGLRKLATEQAQLRIDAGGSNFSDVMAVSFDKNITTMENALTDFSADSKTTIRSMITQFISEFARLSVVRPLLNSLMGNPGELTVKGAASAAGGGSLGSVSGISNVLGLGGLGSAMGSSFGAAFSSTMSGGIMGALQGGMALTSMTGGLMTGLATIAGALGPIALGVVALSSLFGGDDGPKSKGTGNAAVSFDANGNRIGTTYQAGAGESSAAVETLINTMSKGYLDAAKGLGLAARDSFFAVGGHGTEGENDHKFRISGGSNTDKAYFDSGVTAVTDDAMQLAASRAVFAALAGSDLPRQLAGLFDGHDFQTITQEGIDAVLKKGQALQILDPILNALPTLRDLSYTAADGIIAAAGSIEALGNNAASYYNDYTTAEEKRLDKIKAINDKIGALGFDANTASRTDLRNLLEKQNPNDALGQKNIAAILSISAMFASITPEIDAVTTALDSLSDTMHKLLDIRDSQAIELLRAQGNESGANAAQYAIDVAGLTASEKALFDYNAQVRIQIDTLNAAKVAAKAEADERLNLQDELNQLTMTDLELSKLRRDSLREGNRDLYDTLQAEKAAKIERDRLAAVAEQRLSMEVTLMRLQGNEAGALAAERQIELAAMDSALHPLQNLIYGLEDMAAAAEAAAQAANAAAALYFSTIDNAATTASLTAEGAAGIDKFFGSVTDQSNALETAAKESLEAAKNSAAMWRNAASSINSALENIRTQSLELNDNRYQILAARFSTLTTLARAGDTDSAGKLGEAAQAFLAASNQDSKTDVQYARDRARIENSLSATLTIANNNIGVQDAIAAAAQASVNQLSILNTNLTGFAADVHAMLVAGYQGASRPEANDAVAKLARANADYNTYFSNSKEGDSRSFGSGTLTRLGGDIARYTSANGQIDYIRASESLLDVGKRIGDIRAQWETQYGIKLPAFANGGLHSGGARLVGENGPEVEITGRSQIFNAQQTSAMMQGGSIAELVEEVRKARESIERYAEKDSANIQATAITNRRISDILEQVTEFGNAMRTKEVEA